MTERVRAAISAPSLLAFAASASLSAPSPAGWETLCSDPYPEKRDDFAFTDQSHARYGAGKGDFYATADGGRSWSEVAARPDAFIRALGLVDQRRGFSPAPIAVAAHQFFDASQADGGVSIDAIGAHVRRLMLGPRHADVAHNGSGDST